MADLSVDGLRADVDREVALTAKDAAGKTIDTVSLTPATAEVTLAVEQQGRLPRCCGEGRHPRPGAGTVTG